MINIKAYGALADGITNNAAAIQAAIDEATAAGGGTVLVPSGQFLSGSILLKSNVELRLASGAVLISSLNPSDIDPFPVDDAEQETVDGVSGGFFIGAQHAENITISGDGAICGQGEKVFFDNNEDNGFHECPKTCAAFRPRMMLFEDVSNFVVRDVTLKDAAFWTLHMAGCRHVRIRDIRICNDIRGANNDGIDPDSCQDVVISGCIIETGDDAIVIKSTKPVTEKYGPSQNFTITNCILRTHSSALKIGTETYGDIRNIVFSDCIISDCTRGVGIWARDGATIENVLVHHLTGATRRYGDRFAEPGAPGWWGKGEPIFLNAVHRRADAQPAGCIRNIRFDHITITSESCIFIAGEEDSMIRDIHISDMDLTLRHQGTQPGGLFDEQPSERGKYEHNIPALYARSVDGLTVKNCNVRFTGEGEAWDAHCLSELENSCRHTKIKMKKRT